MVGYLKRETLQIIPNGEKLKKSSIGCVYFMDHTRNFKIVV